MNDDDNNKFMTQYMHVMENVRQNWQWFLFLGILLIILGMITIGASTLATIFSVVVLGTLLTVGGLVQIVHALWTPQWSGFFLSILLGIFYTITGLLFIFRPEASAISLTLFIGAFFLISGIYRIVASLVTRFNHWGWIFFNGVITLGLGLLILADWPVSGLWVIGLFLGIDLLLIGWAWTLMALAARSEPINRS